MKQLSHHAHAAAFYAEFFSHGPQQRYVLGLNEYANAVAQRIEIKAFVDEDAAGTVHLGKPVIKLNQIPPDSMVISTCHRRKPRSALGSLRRLPGVTSMDYLAVAQASHGQLPQVTALAQMQHSHVMHPDKFQWVEDILTDPESREVFKRVVDFRLHANLRTLDFFSYSPERIQWESFLKLPPKALVVEADSSAVGTRALDNKIIDPIAFAKIDANGNELQVLHGMAWHIQEDHPVLAVAVYNNPDHLWQVPQAVLNICPDYALYLRHYSEGWADTIMYLLPKP
ncbi:MAG TPA: FkbM family methyltransferase [Limnobacter sp.]|nr:FkbM family methyltransferase [Limnobacter sp.]